MVRSFTTKNSSNATTVTKLSIAWISRAGKHDLCMLNLCLADMILAIRAAPVKGNQFPLKICSHASQIPIIATSKKDTARMQHLKFRWCIVGAWITPQKSIRGTICDEGVSEKKPVPLVHIAATLSAPGFICNSDLAMTSVRKSIDASEGYLHPPTISPSSRHE